MGIRVTRPAEADLERVLRDARDAPPTYQPSDTPPGAPSGVSGFRRDRWWRVLGEGEETFSRACQAIRAWGMHRGAGFVVYDAGPPAVGQTVAMSAPLPFGYIDFACRVTAVVHESHRCGLTYATLPDHPEVGEESFTIIRDDGGQVGLEIIAVWRLRHPLGRLVPPLARLLQRRATERYITAMQDVVADAARP